MGRIRQKVQVHVFRRDDPRGKALFLVIRKPSQKGGFWQPVTGNAEADEKPPETARREVFEETGISDLISCRPIGEFDFENNGREFHETIFAAECKGDAIKLSPEHVEHKWEPYTRARKLIRFESNKTALDRVVELLGMRS